MLINWHDLLPEEIAVAQVAYEKRRIFARVADSGVAPKDMAKILNRPIRFIYKKLFKARHKPNPIEQFCSFKQDELFELARMLRRPISGYPMVPRKEETPPCS